MKRLWIGALLIAACGGGSSGNPVDGAPDGSSVDGRAIDGPPVDGTVADARPMSDAIEGCTPAPAYTAPTAASVGIPDGMAVWLRADLGVSVDTDGLVCEIDDLSGHGLDFTQLSSGLRPSVGTLSGEPAIAFEGGHYLSRDGKLDIPDTAPRTIFVVVQLDTIDARSTFFVQGTEANTFTFLGPEAVTYMATANVWGLYMTGNAYDSQVPTSTDPTIQMWRIDSMTIGQPILDHLSGRVNGTDLTLTRTPAGSGDGTIESFAAANKTWFGYPNIGENYQTAELLVWPRALTALEIGQVEAYLTARYFD